MVVTANRQPELETRLRQLFADLDVESWSKLRSRGRQARALILNTPFPQGKKIGLWNGLPVKAQ